jgi:acetoin utilization deacetylase AcuC-like enzyme
MLEFKLVYHDGYSLPLGEHVFAGEKFRLIHEQLLDRQIATASNFVAPQPAGDDDVLLAHTPKWVRALREKALTAQEEMTLEIPFSPDLVDAFWLHAGGSIQAAELALQEGICVNVGGGFHHAYPGHGEGFCMINDIAIAAFRMLKDKKASRIMIVDCDVHQGNGTAAIFNPKTRPPAPASVLAEGRVFTISLHQENNYPFLKPPSSIDVNLADGTGDDEYCGYLDQTLTTAFQRFQPDLIAYVAGADPYREDQLGGLALTMDGLKRRDTMVFAAAKSQGAAIFSCYAGGYARRVEDTVAIHVNTVLAAQEAFAGR